MWRPDHQLRGPFPATDRDIPAVNRLFSDAFSDRYRRDGLTGVRVPPLDPRIWQFAFRTSGAGAFLWHDDDGQVAAFNMVHRAGREGWMGPLAVRPDRQGRGVGRTILQAGIQWLEDGRCSTIGLETMPRTMDNIGFYARHGFVPGHLTVTMGRDVTSRNPRDPGFRLGALPPTEAEDWRTRALAVMRDATGGADYAQEFAMTHQLELGDASVVADDTTVRGVALWHAAPLTEGRRADEIRVLKLYAEDETALTAVLASVESAAVRVGLPRVSVRCQTRYAVAWRRLLERGYHVRWTDLRMTLAGHPEAETGATMAFTNWEI